MTSSSHSALVSEAKPFRLGPWRVEPESGRLSKEDQAITLEPQLMALLTFLAETPDKVRSREALERALWTNMVVGEDTVARAVSRLRRALGDSARSPEFIETLPKRGYRLIAAVSPDVDDPAPLERHKRLWPRRLLTLAAIGVLATYVAFSSPYFSQPAPPDALSQDVARANDLYMRFTRADNEAAIGLYERVLSIEPKHADAQAGLANALVQRVIRYPRDTTRTGASSLAEALDQGLTQQPDSVAVLERAAAMAERAVRLAPKDPDAVKALAFVYTAQGDLDRAISLYQNVLDLDNKAWAALINLGEIANIRNEPKQAIAYFEQAWEAMTQAYAYEPQRVGPWKVALGVVIGESYEALKQSVDAELWYRQVLAEAPFEPEATVRLAKLLAVRGAKGEARTLCRNLIERLGDFPACAFQ
ncbi:MAG: tetratricopeptide repeat protein [Pseudomonadota bacterium]